MATAVLDQAPAKAVLNDGNIDNWFGAPPSDDIGIALVEGSWPELDAAALRVDGRPQVDGYRRVFPNPDFAPPRFEPTRFGTIAEWIPKYKMVSGWFLKEFRQQLANAAAEKDAAATPLIIPWSSEWVTPGGTQVHKDNGFRLKLGGALIPNRTDGKRYPAGDRIESQGMALIENDLSGIAVIARLNFLAGRPVARVGDYRVDSITYMTATSPTPRGSQGPKAKSDGLVDDRILSEFVAEWEARLALPNIAYGKARAVAPGWTEHPDLATFQPAHPSMPAGDHPRMVPSFTGFAITISDARIEEWLDHLEKIEGKNAILRESRRWFARNLRGWVTDADAPKPGEKRPTRIRAAETGTGGRLLESPGILEPRQRARFAARGLVSEKDGWNLGRDLFSFAQLEVTDGFALVH